MIKYIIAFDCGATKTECALADINGNILYTTRGGAANFLVTGTNETSRIIVSLLNDCIKKFNSNYSDIQKIVIGAAGAGRKKDAGKLESSLFEIFASEGIDIKSLKVVSDAQIALQGAFPNEVGCILIAGTGSIIYGKNERGNIYRVGGFGRLLGDEGSGYSIGRKGLQAAAKYFDGRGDETLIVKLIEEKYSIKTADELITKVYKENFDIASIAEVVLIAAQNEDQIAHHILLEETDEVIHHIGTMMKKMDTIDLRVSFAGSLIINNNMYSDMLCDKIKTSLPSVKIVAPKHSPIEGAILIAKEILND
jgi:N-acetylglucosamine kinase-like BadF-type ATPase